MFTNHSKNSHEFHFEFTEIKPILGTLIACHGYFYAIDEHVITLKDDNSFNRFQSENYWPSKGWEPDQSAYAIYLIKRSFSTKVLKII